MFRIRGGLFAVSLVLILTACGGSDGGSGDAAPAGDGDAVTVTTSTPPTSTTTTQAPPDSSSTTAPAEPTTTTTTPPVATGPSEILLSIQDRGVVNVVVSRAGFDFELDLASAVAEKLVPGIGVATSEVSAAMRFDVVNAGEFDMGLRLTLHTTSRESQAAFSQPYLLFGTAAVVSADSGIASIRDLEGKTIATLGAPGRVERVEDALAQAGVTATVITFDDPSQVEFALSSGDADAAISDWGSATRQSQTSGGALSVIAIDLLHDPVAIYTNAGDPVFAAEVRSALQMVIDDGTWLSLFEKSFGAPPPWTIEEMLAVPPVDG